MSVVFVAVKAVDKHASIWKHTIFGPARVRPAPKTSIEQFSAGPYWW